MRGGRFLSCRHGAIGVVHLVVVHGPGHGIIHGVDFSGIYVCGKPRFPRTRGSRKCEILHHTPNPLKPISPKSTYLPTYPKFGPFCGKILVIWGKFLVNLKIRIFYMICFIKIRNMRYLLG